MGADRPAPGGGFGGQLRWHRLAAGLSQEELGERSGLSARAIADMERGRTTRPYRRSVRALADALALAEPERTFLERASRPEALAAFAAAYPLAGAEMVGQGLAVPRQLPAAVAGFTGRQTELATLTSLIDAPHGARAPALVISAIDGTAGVGKTALAVRWAHQVASRFPDGQLYVNLRGYDLHEPVAAADALAGFMRALGVDAADLPADLDERAAQYRTLLAERRVLVLLDNACSAEQVRPLLPGGAGCAAVVTSRDALSGLVARDGAARLELAPLPLADAIEVLQQQLGRRVDADQQSAQTLARQCALLPLALRTAGELGAARPGVSLADLVAELADQQRRLDLLDTGDDPWTAVRAVFSWSCRHLQSDTVRCFALLGLHPGPDYDQYATAALTGTTTEHAARQLERLARAHLIEQAVPGRYGAHDLLRAYAGELSATVCSRDELHDALTCMFDYYASCAAAAAGTLSPETLPQPPPAPPRPALTDADAARSWLDVHRPTLLAAVTSAAEGDWFSHATRLAKALFRYLEEGGYYPELAAMYGHVRRAAQRTGDMPAEAEALQNICLVALRQGYLEPATAHLRSALRLYRRLGDQAGQTRAFGTLGIAAFLQGHYQQAIRYHQRALKLCRDADNPSGEARTLTNLGLIDLRQGRYQQSSSRFTQALTFFRNRGDRSNEAYCLANLAAVRTRLGQLHQAVGMLNQSLATFREIGNPTGEAYALANLGIAELQKGRTDPAAAHLIAALALARRTRDRAEEAGALNTLGEVSLRAGSMNDAQARHAAALQIASQIGELYEQARAHDGLARCDLAVGANDGARRHWHTSLALHESLGTPEADKIRRQLSEAGLAGPSGA